MDRHQLLEVLCVFTTSLVDFVDLLGLILAFGPWILAHDANGFALTNTLLGIAAIALAMPRCRKRVSYGAWGHYVR